MKTRLPLLLFWFVAFALQAQEPPEKPTVIYVADGDPAEYSLSAPPSNWFAPEVALPWAVAPAGFGPRSRAEEVSTTFFTIGRISTRQRFDLTLLPDSLTLSLKLDAGEIAVYLNGELVVSDDGSQLPPVDADGFRNYDLTDRIGLLQTTGNLLAIKTGGKLLVSVLHGTTPDLTKSAIALDPRRTRRSEAGEALPLRIFRRSPWSDRTLVYLAHDGVKADFRIRRNGVELPLISNQSGKYFEVRFAGDETNALVEFEAVDDVHAEAQESIGLITDPSQVESVRFVIGRNDTIVTRTASSGEGSLFQALENAGLMPEVETIRFSDAEGVPFSSAPVTIPIASGGSYAIRQGLVLEGPPAPGRVTLQGDGGTMFHASNQVFTLRRLVIRGASTAVTSSRYSGILLIEDCEFLDNDQALSPYTLKFPAVIRRCLFEGNRGKSISYTYGLPIEVENCTFIGNQGTGSVIGGNVRLNHCSFIANSTSLVSGTGGSASNCLFLGNTKRLSFEASSSFDQGGNLFDAGESRFPYAPTSSSVSWEDAGLGELGFHGGFTRTVPILAGSPARDLGIPTETAPPGFDQRGDGFPRQVGPAPDAGAYELQLDPRDVAIGLATDALFDPIAGLYFQFVVVHNTTPWTLSGFRLEVDGLPGDAFLYNASGDGFVDVAGPVLPGDYRVVVLQFSASRPDLWLDPALSIVLTPGSDLPDPPPVGGPDLALVMMPDGGRCLEFRTEPGKDYRVELSEDMTIWRPTGPMLSAESLRTIWSDPDSTATARRYYRVRRIE